MQTLKVIQSLELLQTGKEAFCKVQIGELTVQLNFTYHPDAGIGEEKYRIVKPKEVLNLEAAGMQFDYSDLMGQYHKVVENADEYRRTQAERKKREGYKASHVANLTLPVIEGVIITLETEDEFVARTGWHRSKEPAIYVEIDGIKSTVNYRDTSYYSYSKRMRFCVSNEVTDRKDRQYGTLEKCIKKLQELVLEYKAKKESAERRGKAKKQREEQRKEWITSNFPDAEKEKYGSKYYLPINDEKKALIEAYRAMGDEANTAFMFAEIPVPLSLEQINRIIQVINNPK